MKVDKGKKCWKNELAEKRGWKLREGKGGECKGKRKIPKKEKMKKTPKRGKKAKKIIKKKKKIINKKEKEENRKKKTKKK